MKKLYIYIIAVLAFGAVLQSCQNFDSLDPETIFQEEAPERNALDQWLYENFALPYNVEVTYKFEDTQNDDQYTVVPADSAKAAKLAKLVKYMWFDAYDEVVGRNFLKTYSPRQIMMVGSGQYHSEGTVVLGYATGSIKIALLNVNNLTDDTFRDIETLNSWYLSTLHHEFTHILNQKIAFDRTFDSISMGDYVSGSWYLQSANTAYTKGFVRNYAMAEPAEDFAETTADYIVYSDARWNSIMNAAGTEGRDKIERKLAIIRKYLKTSFDIDIDKLREVVQRRASEIDELNLEYL